jgi:hypothetical protein
LTNRWEARGSDGRNISPAAISKELEYGHRMLVNPLAAVAITIMVVGGYRVVLAETMAHET